MWTTNTLYSAPHWPLTGLHVSPEAPFLSPHQPRTKYQGCIIPDIGRLNNPPNHISRIARSQRLCPIYSAASHRQPPCNSGAQIRPLVSVRSRMQEQGTQNTNKFYPSQRTRFSVLSSSSSQMTSHFTARGFRWSTEIKIMRADLERKRC